MQARLTRTLRPRAPFAAAELLAFLKARAIPGVETVDGEEYRRNVELAGAATHLTLRIRPTTISLIVASYMYDMPAATIDEAVAVARRLCDVDSRPLEVDAALSRDPVLAPLVAARPGLRSPGAVSGFEVLVRAITGQQVSVAGARTTLGRIAAVHGDAAGQDAGGRLFPRPEQLAAADPATLGMPHARGRAIVAAAAAVADGLDLADREALLDLRGVGPWTADYVAMRALGDDDAFLPTDLIIRRAVEQHAADPERWRPYRAYAVHHLWAA